MGGQEVRMSKEELNLSAFFLAAPGQKAVENSTGAPNFM
jgi:hypothetical protein